MSSRRFHRVGCCFLWLQMQMADAEEDDNVNTDGSELNKKPETAVAPWVGYNEEEAMKAQILALSKVVFTDLCSILCTLVFQ